MARIPNDELARIKTEVSLLALVEQQGHQVTKQGKDYAVSCPFHDDDTPSCIISPKSNLYHCFGCDAAGSVIDWVMQSQKLSFRHAVEVLQQSNPSLAAKPVTHRQLETLPTEKPDAELMAQVIDYYHETLLQSDEAIAYLEKRGINDRALITRFKLGYANRSLAYRLPEKQYKAGKLLRSQLQTLGLLRATGHEHFTGSLVVPVKNEQGETTEVYGRKILELTRHSL
jgi:DNA primase catalytic core